jgi:lysozyme family protein/peptidoglycan hydrolase-like protein with peptidoglycan-binding domain
LAPSFSALKSDYQLLFDSCLIRPARAAAIDAAVTRIRGNRARYESVGKALGVPWYVVGLIHTMESSGNFDAHLHNGDPLTARTTHVPAGRPAKGTPPFTWEESAADALTMQGFATWKDWSVPGILYKLEAYNGFGYRDNHPDVRSPYLWSFSNHYTSGKYVADGSFSPTAVSAPCGSAVMHKRLVQLGVIDGSDVETPRTLQLTNPYTKGPDVEEAQRLLANNPFGDFLPGDIDGEYGPITADAAKQAKLALGFPPDKADRSFGPNLRSYLDGSKPLPKAYAATRAKALAAAAPDGEDGIRKRIVEWALWGVKNTTQIAYSQGSTRMAALLSPGALPLATDCSAFATLCYAWAKAPNPNFSGAYSAAAGGYTGTLLSHCRRIPRAAAKPGDLVVWTPPGDGSHVCIVVSGGADPWLVSHGSDKGPLKLRFSDEDAYQRSAGHPTAVFLSVF